MSTCPSYKNTHYTLLKEQNSDEHVAHNKSKYILYILTIIKNFNWQKTLFGVYMNKLKTSYPENSLKLILKLHCIKNFNKEKILNIEVI